MFYPPYSMKLCFHVHISLEPALPRDCLACAVVVFLYVADSLKTTASSGNELDLIIPTGVMLYQSYTRGKMGRLRDHLEPNPLSQERIQEFLTINTNWSVPPNALDGLVFCF